LSARSGGSAIAGSDEDDPAARDGPRLEGVDGTGSDLSRILSLSDGVFAFAMTFLAVTILLPQTFTGGALPPLPTYLGRLEPAFLGYVLSFFVIAGWWNVHHRLFSSIVRYDPTLVRLNSTFLLVISVTPFLVSLLFAYSPNGWGPGTLSSRLGVAIYAVVQALGGCVLLGIWRHATRHARLVSKTLTPEWIRITELGQLLSTGTFAISVAVAFLSPLTAELLWIVVILGFQRHVWSRIARRGARTLTRTARGPAAK